MQHETGDSMTPEEIDAIVAGHEMNTLIETLIFKHKVTRRWCVRDLECGGWNEVESLYDDTELHYAKCDLETLNNNDNYSLLPCYEDGIWNIVPDYSSDIVATWKVVEKVKNGGSPKYNGFTLDYDSFHKIWRADFGDSSMSDTAPLAICRAALKAVQNEFRTKG